MTSADLSPLSHYRPNTVSRSMVLEYQAKMLTYIGRQLVVKLSKNDGPRITETGLELELAYHERTQEFTLKLLDPHDLLGTFLNAPSDKRAMVPADSANGFSLIPCYTFKAKKLDGLIAQIDGMLEDEFKIRNQIHTETAPPAATFKVDTLAKYKTAMLEKFDIEVRTDLLCEHEKNMAKAIGDSILETIEQQNTPADEGEPVSDLTFDLVYDGETRDYVLSIFDPNAIVSHYLKAPPEQKTFRYDEQMIDYTDATSGSTESRPVKHHTYRAKTMEDLISGLNVVLSENHKIPDFAIGR